MIPSHFSPRSYIPEGGTVFDGGDIVPVDVDSDAVSVAISVAVAVSVAAARPLE